MSNKIKVLFLAAQPVDSLRLRLDVEVRDIEEKLRSSPKGRYFNLISQWAVRPRDLMELLMKHRPAIVHFSGHSSEGKLILEGERGQSRPIEAKFLANLLGGFRDTIRMVVLNACFTSESSEEFANAIDFTVGTTSALRDSEAVRFSSCFYQALAFGNSVGRSFELAKHQISIERGISSEAFTLLVREGVDSSGPFVEPRAKPKQKVRVDVAGQEEPRARGGKSSPLSDDPMSPPMGKASDHDGGGFTVDPGRDADLADESFRGAFQQVPAEIVESLDRFRVDHPDARRVAFLMMRFGKTKAHEGIVAGLRAALDPLGIAVVRADDKQYHDDLFPNVLTYVYGCGFGIAVFERIEREEFNPNVALEVGYMFALRKQVCLLKDGTLDTLQADLVGKLYRVFDPLDPLGTIPQQLVRWLRDKGLQVGV